VSYLSKCPDEAAEINSLKSSFPSLLISTLLRKEFTSISFPRLSKRVLSSSFDKKPSLLTSAALNYSLSFATYSLLSFLSKCPAVAAAINSLKSSFPSLFTSTLFKKESTSISFPRLYKSVFNSSLDKKPS
jgi:hypothetical protein